MKNLMDLIKERRTAHRFKDITIDEKIILDALQYAIYAPNHRLNATARYRLISSTTKDALLELAQKQFTAKNIENAQVKVEKWRKTPGWMMVTQIKSADTKEMKEDYASISCSLYILMLRLAEQGIASKGV
jgi:nitroreductase